MANLSFGSLGVATNVTALNYRPIHGTSDDEGVNQAFISAYQADVFTLLGDVPSIYNLTLVLSLDGNFTSTHPWFQSYAGIRADTCGAPFEEGVQCFGFDEVDFISTSTSVPTSIALTMSGISGSSFWSQLNFYAASVIPGWSAEQGLLNPSFTVSGSSSAQFGATLRIVSMLITEANGNPVRNLALSSASGLAYPLDPANTSDVPEPGSSALIALGGLAMIFKHRTAMAEAHRQHQRLGCENAQSRG